jgi:hypothetical protein
MSINIETELVRGIFTLVAVALGALAAFFAYFRQKEYELTKQRYLEGGVDIVQASLQRSLGALSHNFYRTIENCRALREIGRDFDLTEFSRGYAQPETSKFEQIANHRISSLTGSGVVWNIFQSAHAKIDFANIEICGDIPNAARQLIKNNKSDADISAAASKMIEHAKKVHDELFEYAEFFKQLHKLGLLLESERLSLKSVAKFCEKSEVKDIIDALRKEYPSDITE